MTTLQKTITIPDNHRINIELSLPESIPAGVADVVVTISPKRKKMSRTPLANLAGSLANSKNFSADNIALVRQWRDEPQEFHHVENIDHTLSRITP